MANSVLDLSMAPSAALKAAPKIVAVHPVGSMLLIELLNSQEITSNTIHLPNGGETVGQPQAYVLATGPNAASEIKDLIGKRIIVDGKGVHVPKFDDHDRTRLLIEYHVVKGVLEEESCLKISTGCCRH